MIGIIDYGVGNLFSLRSSFSVLGQDVFVSGDEKELKKAKKLILPGVGAFGDAAKKLSETGMDEFVVKSAEKGIPLLGICLGMQLLFEKSYEYGQHKGLGLLKGTVVPMDNKVKGLKLPHMGWNSLIKVMPESKLLKYTCDGDFVYFVHSFCADNPSDSLAAVTEYGTDITAAVEKDNVYGCQFHPEKSGSSGLKILKAFCEESESL